MRWGSSGKETKKMPFFSFHFCFYRFPFQGDVFHWKHKEEPLFFPCGSSICSCPWKRKRIWPIILRYSCNLMEFTDWTSPHINPPPYCFSSTWGYQMCQAQFGIRQIQINILLQGATGESPCWLWKKNTLGFICIALCVVCSGSRSQQSSLTPLVERTESSSSISERNEVGILTTLDANDLSHTKCMQCLLWTGTH